MHLLCVRTFLLPSSIQVTRFCVFLPSQYWRTFWNVAMLLRICLHAGMQRPISKVVICCESPAEYTASSAHLRSPCSSRHLVGVCRSPRRTAPANKYQVTATQLPFVEHCSNETACSVRASYA